MARRLALAALTLLITAAAAEAHTGVGSTMGFTHGFGHPFSGLDHILAMVAVGLFAANLGGRALWLVPLSFVAMMAVGGALGVAGIDMPFVEIGIAASVIVLGLAVAMQWNLPVAGAMALVGFFALFHGHAHGAEMPVDASGLGLWRRLRACDRHPASHRYRAWAWHRAPRQGDVQADHAGRRRGHVARRCRHADRHPLNPIDGGRSSLSGVFAPVLTPFTETLAPDRTLFVRFCRWLIGQGAGLAVFGTNSEANSLSVEEKLDLLAALLDAGIAPDRLMPGTGACAIPDAVRLSAAAAKAGTAAVLMLPPFYYKGVSEDGVFAYYAEVIERVGDDRLKICLYHIPHLSGVAITRPLIARLIARYPDTVVGIKDSGGDFANTKAMLDEFPGFRVFCGSETFLTDTLAHGGAGCISAAANVNPAAIVAGLPPCR